MSSPQIWLITGTSSGLGAAFVKAVIARGGKVIATARNVDSILHLKALGAETLQLDVSSSQEELNKKAQEAISIHGKIDVLVNNAGYVQFGTVEETTIEEWNQQYQTNVFGTLNTTRAFLPHLRHNKSGTIIFNGSMAAWDGVPTAGAYCSSKAALHYAVESLSREVARFGIKTLLIEPGTFRTNFLSAQSQKRAVPKYNDYEEINVAISGEYDKLAGNQTGDPQKAAELVVDVVKGENGAGGRKWPSSLLLGSDAVDLIRKRCQETLRELDEWEVLSRSTDV
ncbi:hypothetical protein N7478_008605 [Penicillium angulare]|uniref:uncharacterized protein n=1 Tax=Penicillium angulare TaxID=116970 RepID=UPI00253F702C|nr:uncharacterized protein N7478_008605 [Penicillium angulare]KAJ5273480.1 hypothetical protein N7478_008605 [Penicillium angulare]